MAGTQGTPSSRAVRILLDYIPATQRSAAIRDVVSGLAHCAAGTDRVLAVALWNQHSDPGSREVLLTHLRESLEHGDVGDVLSICSQEKALAADLLHTGIRWLQRAATQLRKQGRLIATVSHEPELQHADSQSAVSSDVVSNWLRFVKLGHSLQVPESDLKLLLQASLALMGSLDKQVASNGRDVATIVFSHSQDIAIANHHLVWKHVASLASTSSSPFHQTLGYQLWLRWLTISLDDPMLSSYMENSSYKQLITQGLRYGDTERRKLCLEILRRSSAMARGTTEPGSSNTQGATSTFLQYNRYCTIFETIILARYGNLVQECGMDLDLLASPKSLVEPRWFNTLLATALDTKTREQNRKFIGNWIMRSCVGGGDMLTQGFADVLRNGFLPWVIQGKLFVSTLKSHASVWRSSHGERLAAYVEALIERSGGDEQHLALVVDTLLKGRLDGMFPYAYSYLLEGIRKAFQSFEPPPLRLQQVQTILELSAWTGIPEVARDHISSCCWMLVANSPSSCQERLPSIAKNRFNDLRAATTRLSAEDASLSLTSITQKPPLSQRDGREQSAVDKCEYLASQLRLDGTPLGSAELLSMVDDIWSDLEYLEFPRSLLTAAVAVFLDRTLLKQAIQDLKLSTLLSDIVLRLQDQAERKSYLMASLVTTLRTVALTSPHAVAALPLEDMILRIARSPPEPGVELQLEYAAANLLSSSSSDYARLTREHYFGMGESHCFAAFLDLISRLSLDHHACVVSVFDQLLERWRRQKQPLPTISSWKNTLHLQVMLLCFEQVSAMANPAEVGRRVEDLHFALSIEPLPRYRYLLEWMITRAYMKHKELQQGLLDRLSTKDHHSNPKYLASLMKIGATLASTDAVVETFATELATSFIALSSSSKVIIRHESQWSFPKLMDLAAARSWTSITQNPAYSALDGYIRSLPRWDAPPPERIISGFDPMKDHTLTHLAEGRWTELDYTRPPFARHADFVKLYEADGKDGLTDLPPSCMALGQALPTTASERIEARTKGDLKTLADLDFSKQPEAIALQTKGTAYLLAVLQDHHTAKTRNSDLLVIASLVDNPHNLGGLCRVSEIFGASALYIQDPRVIGKKDFTSLSVSSHNHIPLQPLLTTDIPAFCAEKRGEGFTIVGVEQTDRSVLLGEAGAELPEKTVLVLGSEREGMPGTVLSECDLLVEIPQVGVTRSLNVQTAAAIALFEYSRQHRREAS